MSRAWKSPARTPWLGKVLTAIFELNGQRFMALDGGPIFKFNEAISFYVECEDQAEVDYFWERLSAVPESEQCGWLKDKFGLSWQISPQATGRASGRARQEEVLGCHECHAQDEEDRDRGSSEGVRRSLSRSQLSSCPFGYRLRIPS